MSEPDNTQSDQLMLADDVVLERSSGLAPWKLLVVDDEKVVHAVTSLALDDFELAGRGLMIISAYSAAEARRVLEQHPDVAMILLDVVMESDSAGLDLAKYIREELGNKLVRIVLRTGQAGQAPEHEVITRYDINDYKEKTELTRQKLFSTVYTGLKSYRDLIALDENRKGLLRVINASAEIFERRSLGAFCSGVLDQLIALLYLNNDAMLVQASAFVADRKDSRLTVLAATGVFKRLGQHKVLTLAEIEEVDARERLAEAMAGKNSVYGPNYWASYYRTASGNEQVLYVTARDNFSVPDTEMIELFVKNVAIAHENAKLMDKLQMG